MQSHKLLSFLKCPVCLETMKPPILQCSTGHAMCSKCQKRIDECPLCKSPISNTRSFALEALSEELIECLKCHHKIPLCCLQVHEENFCGKEGLQRRELALNNLRNMYNTRKKQREYCEFYKQTNNFEDQKAGNGNNSEMAEFDTEFDILFPAASKICHLLVENIDSSRSSRTKSENPQNNMTDIVECSNTDTLVDDIRSLNNSWTTINGSDKSLSDSSASSLN